MGLKLVTPPAVEPIGLQEAKDHLRVDVTDDDALIDQLIISARDSVEGMIGRQLITATYGQTWDFAFPRTLELLKPPLIIVNSVKYIDGDGVEQTVDASKYTVDLSSQNAARIVEAFGETWPTPRVVINAVTVNFDAGYGPGVADVPAPIKSAILLMIAHLYENRSETHVGTAGRGIAAIPMGVVNLLRRFWSPRF